jgi:hypothetical protein
MYCVFTCRSHVTYWLYNLATQKTSNLMILCSLILWRTEPAQISCVESKLCLFFYFIKMIQKCSLFIPRIVNFNSSCGKPTFQVVIDVLVSCLCVTGHLKNFRPIERWSGGLNIQFEILWGLSELDLLLLPPVCVVVDDNTWYFTMKEVSEEDLRFLVSNGPVTVAECSKAWIDFSRSDAVMVGSNST